MKTSLHSHFTIETLNSLHETNGKYENLNSMKLHLQYYHTTYYRCSYVFNSGNRFTLANLTTSSKFGTQ